MAVMKDTELVKIVKDIANNYKTLYIYGCFGSPMNATNKKRYTSNYAYNEQPSRKQKILNASSNTFGFDCVNLIKGVLWGWNGNLNATYGGAVYGSNGVPDTNANGMFKSYCTNKSSNFSNIVAGEFVWMDGHIGVYIGNGLVVECTPIWKDGVQITACGNIGKKSGYNTRTWTQHGKSKFIQYTEQSTPSKLADDKSFFGSKGYFSIGDTSPNIGKIAAFMRKVFPAHTSEKALGNYYGPYIRSSIAEFQKRTGLKPDGCVGPLTLAKLKQYGFKE